MNHTFAGTRGSLFLDHDLTVSSFGRLEARGCVVCNKVPACSKCQTNEQCAMTTQTCEQCPTTYCETIVSSSNSTSTHTSLSASKVGGIAGSLSALFFLVFVGGIYLFFRNYRKKMDADFELGIGEEMKGLAGFDNDEDEETPHKRGSDVNLRQSNIPRRPKRVGFAGDDESKRYSQTSLSTVTNSILTKASNVLNIAYVPGVTSSRPSRNTRGRVAPSIYSRGMSIYSKETYFSDLENASFHGGKVATKGGNPTLVEIHQDDYNFDEDVDELDEDAPDEGLVEFTNDKESVSADNYEYSGISDFPIKIDLQIPKGDASYKRQTVKTFDEGEEDEFAEEEEEEEEEEGDNGMHAMIDKPRRDIVTTQRSVPTRYASLIEKKNMTKRDTFFASKPEMVPPQNRVIGAIGVSDSEIDSESDSDSDEENIEFFLQQNAQSSMATNSAPTTLNGNPFASQYD